MRDQSHGQKEPTPANQPLPVELRHVPGIARERLGELDVPDQTAFLGAYGREKKNLRVAYLLWPLFVAHRVYLDMDDPDHAVLKGSLDTLWPPFAVISLGILFWLLVQRLLDVFRMYWLVKRANEETALRVLRGVEGRRRALRPVQRLDPHLPNGSEHGWTRHTRRGGDARP